MGRTGVVASMSINPITTISAVSDPGLTSMHWILYYQFLHYIALSTLNTKVQTKNYYITTIGRTPTLTNSCYTRNNYAPMGTVRDHFCTPINFFNSYTSHTKIVKSRAVCMLRPRFDPLALDI